MDRIILHCDMDNYFASVEEKYNPILKSVPFAVCGDPELRHSIVMSKNGQAKSAGVLTGLSYQQARQVCPQLKYVRADYRKYLDETKCAREIYRKYTDTVIPYGMDEAWIDLTETGVTVDEARQIADLIRIEIKYSRGLSASIGVSDNYIFSKLGSDYKKPDSVTLITRENYKQLVWQLPASALLFVGKERCKKLSAIGINTIGDIARAEPSRLKRLLGKAGYDLWQFANGDDRSFHPENDAICSVGNTITPPENLHTVEDVGAVLYLLAATVAARLKKHSLKACCVSICVKDSGFNRIVRQCCVSCPTDSTNMIFNKAYELFNRHYGWERPLRSAGIRVDNLITEKFEQMTMFEENDCAAVTDIAANVKALTARLGNLNIEKTASTKEW